MPNTYDALALLSGGLDSLLAARTVMDQGLKVLGLHFTTPFFGKPHLIPFWREHYGVEVVEVPVHREYVDMILAGPASGFGKWLNPCIDCKVLMLRRAKELMPKYGAKFLISGEVVGQRPMSQRKDALNQIKNRAEVGDILLRPLCAKCLEPTPMEESGLVDRERLLDWRGRGRKPQMAAAREYGFTEIPTPAGGCCLTEGPSSARFVTLLRYKPEPEPDDFFLARIGRQVWAGPHWLITGRVQADNQLLESQIKPDDYVLKVEGFPGPLGVARPLAGAWSEDALRDACALVASYSGKGVKHAEKTGKPVDVRVRRGDAVRVFSVMPTRDTPLDWREADPEAVREWKQGPDQG